MNKQELLDLGQNMSENSTIRFECCGQDKSLAVRKTHNRIQAYCHRCKFKMSVPLGMRRISELNKAIEIDQHVCKIPDDCTPELPVKAIIWLRKYGITPSECEQFKIQYSPKYNRVVLPVYSGDTLVFVQLRRLSSETLFSEPKYINLVNKQCSDRPLFIKPTTYGINSMQQVPKELTAVVTEDMLSAIKVHRVISSMPLLGTNLTNGALGKLWKHNIEDVIFWLDADDAGNRAINACAKQVSLLGMTPYKISGHTKDPKEYSTEEIISILNTRKVRLHC